MKNVFKKVICLVLALTMCAGMMAFATEEAVTEEVVVDQAATDVTLEQIDPSVISAMDLLRSFGAIADYYETNINVEEYVTRADFVNSLAKIMNLELKARTDTYFYDVPPKHFANPAISSLAEMNLINGVGDNCFEPDELIETAAACKILLSVLGYDERAKYEGGYPSGYIKVAKRLELIDSSYTDEYLKRGDMFVLLLTAIRTPMFVPVSFSDTKGNLYQVAEEETILSQYYDAFYSQGTVQGANMMSINESELPEETYVEIDGVVYDSEVDLSDMIGEKVNFIAKEAHGTEDATVIWAERNRATKVFEISAKQYAGFEPTTYELSYYDEDGKKDTIKLDRALSLVYNGGLITENLSEILGTACDYKIVESDDSTVVIAKEKTPFVVNSVDVVGEVISNYIAGGRSAIDLNTDTRAYVVIKDADGKKISISDIAIGNVLMVYESKFEAPATYGDYIEIVVGSTTVSGTVDKVKDTDTGRTVTIAGAEYNDISGIDYALGKKVTAYIDQEGDLVYATTISDSDFVAYVTGVELERGVFENIVSLRVFKADGSFAVYEGAEDVVIDGIKKESEDLYDIVTDENGAVEPQLVLIKLDSDGKISYFDTPALNRAYEGEGTIRPSVDPTGKTFVYKYTGYLMDHRDAHNVSIGAYAFDASTVIFRTPPKADIKAGDIEDKQFGIGWGTYVQDGYGINEKGGTVTGMYRTTDKIAATEDYIIIEGYGKSTASTRPVPILVESTGMAIDENGDLQYVITGYDGTNSTTKIVSDEAAYYNRVGKELFVLNTTHPMRGRCTMETYYEDAVEPDYTIDDIKRGMVVELETDNFGVATGVAVIYDPEAPAEDNYFKMQPQDTGSDVGVALDVDVASGLMALNVPGDWYSDTIKNLTQVLKVGSAKIMVYDGEQGRNNIYAGTLADIRTAKDSPGNETTVLIYSNATEIGSIYVFK